MLNKVTKKLIRRVNPWKGRAIAYDLILSEERLKYFESFLNGRHKLCRSTAETRPYEGDIERKRVLYSVPPYLSLRTSAEKRIFPDLPVWELVFVLMGIEHILQDALETDDIKRLSMRTYDRVLPDCEWLWQKGLKGSFLKKEFFPLSEEIAQVALAAVEDTFLYSPLELSDRFELWMLDKEAHYPIALVATAESLDEILYRPFSPIEWFFHGEKAAYPSLLALAEDIDSITCSTNSEEKEGYFLIVVEKNKYAHFEYLVDRDTGNYDVRTAEEPYPENFLCDRLLEKYEKIVEGSSAKI